MKTLAAIITELKRRRVFRVAVVYAGVAFIIFQIVDATFEPLHLPDWAGTLVVVLLALGFPVAVALAWAFDITEKGVVKTRPKEEVVGAKAPRRLLISNRVLIIIAVAAVAVAVWSYLSKGEQPGPISAIAVLPMENLMNDPDQEYFVDGMTEALISELGKISALRVISRTSVMQYKAAPKPLPEIARELNVDAVVEGSVLRAGDQVRITAQLVATRPERHLWTDNYTRDLRDILELQSEVARAIAREIRVALTPEEETRMASARPVDPAALDAYVRGRYFWNKRTGDDILKAKGYFEQAIELDPLYAQAYAGLADCYNLLPFYAGHSRKEAFPKAQAAALKALEMDDNLAQAHSSLAFALTNDWDWEGAEGAYRRALKLNPSYATGHHWYAWHLGSVGRLDEALAEIMRAEESDPLSLIITYDKGWIHFGREEYEQAIEQCQKVLEMAPGWRRVNNLLTGAYDAMDMEEKAFRFWKERESSQGLSPEELAAYQEAYDRSGMRGVRRLALTTFKKEPENRYMSPIAVAWTYAYLGDKDGALKWLEKAYEERSSTLMLGRPIFRSLLGDDPRYTAFLKKVGLE